MNDIRCEACSGFDVDKIKIDRALTYVICNACKHCSLDSDITQLRDTYSAAQEKYFGEGSVLLHSGMSLLDAEYIARRKRVVSRFLREPKEVVEVGPGSGEFLRWAEGQGHKMTAIEASKPLAQALARSTGALIVQKSFEDCGIASSSQDAVCSFHVIEHVLDPKFHLLEAKRIVRIGGLAFVATPNSYSWQQRLFPNLSPNFDAAHLRVFSKQSLARLAHETGWEILYSGTPEYTSAWLRVVTKGIRKLRREDAGQTAGKYATGASSPWAQAILLISQAISWPARAIQSALDGGNEIFLVLQRIK